MNRLAGIGALLLLGGCSYAMGNVSYVENPELRNVRLYSGRPDPTGEDLGPVDVVREGGSDCTELGNQALADLLREAKALGGTGVKDVRFRGRYHWMGRMVCRRSIGGMSVQVRGIATR